eukprot:606402-Pyramimonas_sp.AAC.1
MVYFSVASSGKLGNKYTPLHPDVVPDPQKSPGIEKPPATGNVDVPIPEHMRTHRYIRADPSH